MLDTDDDALLEDLVADRLGDLDADGSRGDVPDLAGLADVVAVRHALVDRAVALDVDEVADTVDGVVGVHVDLAVLAELAGEGVSSLAVETVRVSHDSTKDSFCDNVQCLLLLAPSARRDDVTLTWRFKSKQTSPPHTRAEPLVLPRGMHTLLSVLSLWCTVKQGSRG